MKQGPLTRSPKSTPKKLSKSQRSARAVDAVIAAAPERRDLSEGVDWKLAEQALLQGDLGKLSNEEQVKYVLNLCRTLGLNPLTRPFQWMLLDGKLTLYSTKNCADQLRAIHNIKVELLSAGPLVVGGQVFLDVYEVKVVATMPNGRSEPDTGVVSIKGLSGVELANAIMRATTKAKRRVTNSITGLSMLDESELDGVRYQLPEKSEEVRRVAPPPALTPSKVDQSKVEHPLPLFEQPAVKAQQPVQAVAAEVIPATKPPIEEVSPPNPAPPPAPFSPIAATTPVQPLRGPLPPPARPSAPPVAMPSRPRR